MFCDFALNGLKWLRANLWYMQEVLHLSCAFHSEVSSLRCPEDWDVHLQIIAALYPFLGRLVVIREVSGCDQTLCTNAAAQAKVFAVPDRLYSMERILR